MGGKGKTVIEAPKPINVEESMRDYLNAITDPELVEKQLDAERMFGPQFDAVSLTRTRTMLEGMNPKELPEYSAAIAKRTALQARKSAILKGDTTRPSRAEIEALIAETLGPRPDAEPLTEVSGSKADVLGQIVGATQRDNAQKQYDAQLKKLSDEYESGWKKNTIADINKDLREVNKTITKIEKIPEQKGILDMAEDAAIRMQNLQDRIDTAKRTGDIRDLENLGPGLVEALRKADPQSAALADASAELAQKAQTRALEGVEQTEERIAMGEIAQRGADRIAQLETLEEEARTPEENVELQNLKDIRDQQASLFEAAQARVDDPMAAEGRGDMGFLADAATMAAAVAPAEGRGEIANLQSLSDAGMLSARAAQSRAMSPNLAQGRAQLGFLADAAQREAFDPSVERTALGFMASDARRGADEMFATAGAVSAEEQDLRSQAQTLSRRADEMFAAAGRVTPEQEALRLQSQELFAQADELMATAGDVSPEQQAIRNQASQIQARAQQLFAQAEAAPSAEKLRLQQEARNLQARSDQLFTQADTEAAALRERAGQVTPEQQALRNQARAMQERALGLFAEADAAPSERKQELEAAATDMMERGQGLFAQAATPSLARRQAGALTRLSAEQARQLSADALGPLSNQRRRLAEQAARQAGLRTGRIGDQMQLAAELLSREESKAALRAEAREAQDLAYRQAAGFATDLETDAERLRQQALDFESSGLTAARGVESDIDAQRLALLQEGRLAEASALAGARGIESDILDREAALLAEARLSGQALRGDALTAQAAAAAQARGIESDIDAQRLALIQEGRLAEAAALEGALGIEGQITDQRLRQQAQALDARQMGLTTGTALERAIADQEVARQRAANELAISAAGEGRLLEGQLADQELARLQEARLRQAQAFTQTGDLIEADRAARTEAAVRQQAVLDADAALREEARLERQAAELAERGLLDEAQSIREEAADRREEAMDLQERVAAFDAGLREEAQQALSARGQMSAGILSAEEQIRQQRLDEAAGLRGEISEAEQTAFAREGQLAGMDEALRAGAVAESLALGGQAFNQAQAIASPSTQYLLGTSGAGQQGQASVSQAPAVSQAFGEMFNPEPGLDVASVNAANLNQRNIAQANIAAQERASQRGLFGDVISAFNPFD